MVGGNAGDETSWVDHVSLQLPGAGTVTAEGQNPWAYTWNLPADGVYDLTATAYDYLGHASAARHASRSPWTTPPPPPPSTWPTAQPSPPRPAA